MQISQQNRPIRICGNLAWTPFFLYKTVVSLEEEFDCEIPDEKLLLLELNTVNKIYEVLTSIDTEAE